jgi:hypothetical protein
MKKVELIKIAKGLNIKTESKTVKELKDAIAKSKAKKAKNAPAKVGRRLSTKMEKIANFDQGSATVWTTMLHAANDAEVNTFKLGNVLKMYLESLVSADNVKVTDEMRAVLTFKNISKFITESPKYKHLPVYTFHQIKLICNSALKETIKSIELSERVAKQAKNQSAKALAMAEADKRASMQVA